jgi:putative ABC transport system permease protein
MKDMVLAIRNLRRQPSFAITAILTLALGTGATAAVFSLVNGVLLRPFPWRAPERVGLIWAVPPSGARTWLSFPELDDLQRETTRFSAVAGFTDLRPTLVASGVGHELQALAVSHQFFGLLGVTPSLGRDFTRQDDRAGAAPVAILGDAFWRSRFGGDPAIVGRQVTLNDQPYVVVGVLPAGFTMLPPSSVLPERVDVWLPLEPHLASRNRSVRFLHALGRLRDDATFTQASDELHAYGARVRTRVGAAYADGAWSFSVVSFADDVLADARIALYLLFGLVVLVLMMACANVANLLLVRGEARRLELAIRTALGAAPSRLARELLTEALVLAACGSVLGLVFAAAAPIVLRSMDPGALPRLNEAHIDPAVVVFMLGLVLLTALVLASVPLLDRLRLTNPGALMGGRSGGRTRRSARRGQMLAIAQTAMATTIVVTTVFLSETFIQLQRVDLGFEPDQVLTGRIALSSKYAPGAPVAQFFDRAIAAAVQLPGVTAAGAITQLPLSGSMLGSTFLAGTDPEPRRIDADLRGITPTYFDAVGTPLVEGRRFTDRDSPAAPPVAIVDELFARQLTPDGRVIGRRIRWFRQPDVELEIVGVVRSVRHRGPADPIRETVYRPHWQYSRPSMFLAVRTRQDAASAVPQIRAALASLDASQPFADVSTLDQRLDRSVSRARTSLMLAGVLATIALALGLVGLYGVLSFGVAQRVREFGVRMALGATPAAVRGLVLREGLALTTIGGALGVLGAAVLVRAMQSVLYGIAVTDLLPYVLGLGFVFAASAVAFGVPAVRAGTADPLTSLRSE